MVGSIYSYSIIVKAFRVLKLILSHNKQVKAIKYCIEQLFNNQ